MILTGKHLIAGEWVAGEASFRSSPASGAARDYAVGTPAHVDRAVQAAEEAFWSYSALSRDARATFLDRIADEIEARGAEITEIGTQETGLPAARLDGERGRTTGQLRLFASHIRKGEYLDPRHDLALPDRKPLQRPDIRLIQRPIGPVAVFRRVELPAGLFHGRGRHGFGAGRRLPRGGQGPFCPSRHGRDRGTGGGLRPLRPAASIPACSA